MHAACLYRQTFGQISIEPHKHFFFFESFEHAPEPLAKVKVILEAHDKAATRFFNELFASPFAGSDTGVYAHHLIQKNFKESLSVVRVFGTAGWFI